ncbi:MAG: hypothetical protein M3Q03_10505 [Chloroflexota bacterium]|nr:hypothetical protein [Chloroflexota bacterium]
MCKPPKLLGVLVLILFATPLTVLAQDATPGPGTGLDARDANDITVPPDFAVELVADGLPYLSDITFDDQGTAYLAATGGHTYGTAPEMAPPPQILKLLPDGGFEVVFDDVVPLDVIRDIPIGGEFPEGLISLMTGITWHDGLLYVSHRTRISTLNPETGQFTTIVDNLPDWGEFHVGKPIFGPDGKLYFFMSSQGNTGPVDAHWMKVMTIFNKPLAHEIPCEAVTLTGEDFAVVNDFTDEPGDWALTGVYVPFGVRTEPGQVIPGQVPCNGAMHRVNADGTELEVFAWGLRSDFGYRFSPSGRLIATQNSCNPIPPRQVYDDWEPIYHVEEGVWYGWPDYCSSVPIVDDRFAMPDDKDFTGEPEVHEFVLTESTRNRLLDGAAAPPPPLVTLRPHSAAQGMVFGRAEWGMDPESEILVAEWGNIIPYLRDDQPGFKVERVNLLTGETSDFVTNAAGPGPASMLGNKGLERPIMVEWGPDGALYVVDFGVVNITEKGMSAIPNTGAIWRVTRTGEAGTPGTMGTPVTGEVPMATEPLSSPVADTPHKG